MSEKIEHKNQRRKGPGGPGHGMAMPVEKAKDAKGTLKRLIGLLRPYRLKLIIILILAIASTIFSIVSPKIMAKITDELGRVIGMRYMGMTANIDFDFILRIVVIVLGLYVMSAAFSYIQRYSMATVAQRTVYNLRKKVDLKLEKLPLKYYDSTTHGDIMSRVANDVENIASTLQDNITQFITSVVTMIGVTVMMLSISGWMTLVCIAIIPFSAIAVKFITKYSRKYFKEQWAKVGDINGHIEEMYSGHKVVKAFGHEKDSIKYFEENNNKLYKVSWKAQFISGIIMPVMTFLNNISYVAVCVVGGIFAVKGTLSIGDIQAFISYSKQFTQPIAQTASIANTIQSTLASAERVFEVLDSKEEIPNKEDDIILENPKGNVIFDHVKFGYDEGITIINDMNISVNKGDVVAIVGPTGAGKTTLVNLLMRFYDVGEGSISVDGVDIRDMQRENLRNVFGMVLQDTWLFNGTIKENIAYGNMDSTDEEVFIAAKAAYADHFIRTLPNGYDTVLNEEASNISQGQKQLLTIARAILANPAILILDEATSSVDTRTEVHIQSAMLELMKGRTNFVIAHRLSTIKDADMILVMDKGDLIEKGTHEELLAQKGFYADLYNSQFSVNKLEA